MIKKLRVIGNSLGIIIDRPILDLLRIEKDTPLEISTDGEALIIRPSRPLAGHSERVHASAEKAMTNHEKTMRKLAE